MWPQMTPMCRGVVQVTLIRSIACIGAASMTSPLPSSAYSTWVSETKNSRSIDPFVYITLRYSWAQYSTCILLWVLLLYYSWSRYSTCMLSITAYSSILCLYSPAVFCVYYCYDGLLRERPFEIIGFAFTIFILTTYIIVNYFVEGEQGDMIKLVRKKSLEESIGWLTSEVSH